MGEMEKDLYIYGLEEAFEHIPPSSCNEYVPNLHKLRTMKEKYNLLEVYH